MKFREKHGTQGTKGEDRGIHCARACVPLVNASFSVEVKQYDGGKGRGHGPLALPRLPHREFVTGELIVG